MFGKVHIKGTKAGEFLQGQTTCDVSALKVDEWSLGACCDPKGRVIANFILKKRDNDFVLFLPPETAPLLITHLSKYAIFSKVEVTACDESLSDHSLEVQSDPIHCINTGTVWIVPETSGQLLPQSINLHKKGGVSFKKGCYVGQEIIARTEHLGHLKKHLYRASVRVNSSPKLGDTLEVDHLPSGIIVAVAPNEEKNKGYQLLVVLEDRMLCHLQNVTYQSCPVSDIHPC